MNVFTELWTIKLSDWQRALIVAILTGPLDLIYQWAVKSGPIDWMDVLKTAIAGGIAYIIKRLHHRLAGESFEQ